MKTRKGRYGASAASLGTCTNAYDAPRFAYDGTRNTRDYAPLLTGGTAISYTGVYSALRLVYTLYCGRKTGGAAGLAAASTIRYVTSPKTDIRAPNLAL
jgi:hypothetical protein